jgi:hypothetical protein
MFLITFPDLPGPSIYQVPRFTGSLDLPGPSIYRVPRFTGSLDLTHLIAPPEGVPVNKALQSNSVSFSYFIDSNKTQFL